MTARERAAGAAHGKVILLGEHAVVYGAPAIAAGLDRGARATATRRAEGPSELRLGDRTVRAGDDDDLARSFAALLEVAPAPACAVDAIAELPPGGGLGCSAALGVAIARAVAALDGAEGELDAVAARALAWETIHHGNPSGIDTTAALRGGCFRFTRAGGAHPIRLGAPLAIAVGSSGAGASTKAMVASVARLRDRRPEVVDRAIEGITSLVDNAALALEAGDHAALGKLLDLNQMILAGLMVSTEALEAMCALARGAGALGAKLTGAGGGGSAIALLPSPRDPKSARVADDVLAAWRGAGYDGFVAHIEAEP